MNRSIKNQKRERRHKRIRAKISGTAACPRLCVFKSNKAIYTQLVDDDSARTLATASGKDAAEVGRAIAKQALANKIEKVVFDRGGYIYTGKISALAEAARKTGLKF